MQSNEIRQRFLKFFDKRGHAVIPSASLVPQNDPSVLFNTAGMQPLVPYLLGEKHPAGTRIVDVQKCVRTTDIEEVGDNTHLTFFEMMGNWSLGDYFKKEAINWSYEFLTDKEEGLGLDPRRLYVTVFEGNSDAPKDEESYGIWKEIFEKNGFNPEKRIFFMPAKNNWWSPGDNGPCGPDSEMFYDVTGELIEGMTKEEFIKADDEQKIVEIWNDVFMEYEKKDGKVIGKLKQHNVDTGAGLERVTTMVQGKRSVYETDLFATLINQISKLKNQNEKEKIKNRTNFAEQNSSTESSTFRLREQSEAIHENTKSVRIVSDHIRTSVFMISDGVVPANTDAGYILRRIIRRAVRHADSLGISDGALVDLANIVIDEYGDFYTNLKDNAGHIKEEIRKEEEKFRKTLRNGLKELDKMSIGSFAKSDVNGNELESAGMDVTGKNLFVLFSTYGFPFEMSIEELKKIQNSLVESGTIKEEFLDADGIKKLKNDFDEEMKKHQELSRTASVGKFKGGLGGHDENSTKLHTATHLLNQALREVLGDNVQQKGSNITPERLRFDFSYPEKLTDEQKQKVEDIVNEKIKEALPVTMEEMTVEDAKSKGAVGVFGDKYGEKVKVYSIGDFSKEICGGPHVENTSELGHFKIKKEEASSAGVRRIKAVLS